MIKQWIERIQHRFRREQCDAVQEVAVGGFICCVKRKGHRGAHVDYSGFIMRKAVILTDSAGGEDE